jgi:hypothetical protein
MMARCDTTTTMDTMDFLVNTDVMVRANIVVQDGWNYIIVDG